MGVIYCLLDCRVTNSRNLSEIGLFKSCIRPTGILLQDETKMRDGVIAGTSDKKSVLASIAFRQQSIKIMEYCTLTGIFLDNNSVLVHFIYFSLI